MRKRRPSSRCPQCGTHVTQGSTVCLRCGIELADCQRCGSLNIAPANFCHMCGESMIPPTTSNEISKIVMWETLDLDDLDNAVLAILRVRGGMISLSEASAALGISPEELDESIGRLEQTHRIERSFVDL